MKLYTKNVGSNYLAKIVKIGEVQKHPNADKLALTFIDGNKVIVGKDTKPGDIYIYFPLESTINKNLIRSINGFTDPALNADGKSKGFFNDKARVRAVKLRGTPSEGYLMSLDHFLAWTSTNPESFKLELQGYLNKEFDSVEFLSRDGDLGSKIENLLVCEKYVPARQFSKGLANTPKKDKTKRFDRMVEGQFHFHVDTEQLKKNVHRINPNDLITISYKLHGTSAVFANILVKKKLRLRDKVAKFFGVNIQETEYDIIYSSRQVLKNKYLYDEKTPNHYYKEDIWGLAKNRIADKIEKGITIYAEIVGYTPNGSWIQKNYDYGCNPNDFDIYVYRITSTNMDGKVTEFTTEQILRYCDRKGLKTVPIYFYGRAKELINRIDIEDFRKDLLECLIKQYTEIPCNMCKNNVPAEGIVVTVEKDEFTAFKLKSFAFYEQETKLLDAGEVDTETQQTIEEQ